MIEFLPGNKITLLQNGTEYFPALEAAFDAASQEIFLQTYIFAYDATGLRIAAALQRAARRGVKVYVLLDGFGSKTFPQQALQSLRDAGVQVLYYRPEISPWSIRRHRLRRLHRKLVLVDGRTAFVGGINIIDDLQKPVATVPRFDYAVAVEGPLLAQIQPVVSRLWALVAWTHFKHRWKKRGVSPRTESVGDKRAAFVVRDNIGHRRDIEEVYLDAIHRATKEIIIANAYFLPGLDFRHALSEAAARGVRVVLLLQGRVEYFLLHHATRALYASLLEDGIEIYEYQSSFLHAKVAVIDGDWATVGSSNIDPFSLVLSREANVVVRDVEFAQTLRGSLEQAIAQGAQRLKPEDWKKQKLIARIVTWASYGFVRFLMGMVGYAREDSR